MSFIDALKRSLGFEETESNVKNENKANDEDFISTISANISDLLKNISKPSNNGQSSKTKPQNNSGTYSTTEYQVTHPRPTPIPDDDYVIVPERSFYEIILFRPKTIDDSNYIVDQIVDEKNPVIVDLSFLEKESEANYKLAGEKIKHIRTRHDAQAVLLEHTEEKHLILLSPRKVNIVNKG